MRQFFECMRCYSTVIDWIVRAFLVVWPVLAGYAILYAVGAAALLVNLRANRDDYGNLFVKWDSLIYKLAHPYKYGKIRKAVEMHGTLSNALKFTLNDDWFIRTSICVIYARAFNALLFMWPAVLVYWAIVCSGGTLLFGLLLGGAYIRPNLYNDAWLEVVDFYTDDNDWAWYKAPVVYLAGAAVASLAIFKLALLAKILLVITAVLLCISPAVAIVAGSTLVVKRIRRDSNDPTTSVAVFSEYVAARKEKFCKLVAIK